jgi:hypothetical protein
MNILHFGGVTLRVVGSGNLQLKFLGYDRNQTQDLVPLVMQARPGRTFFRLANFIDERGQLEVRTEAINEHFKIHQIIVHAKPIYTSYPG